MALKLHGTISGAPIGADSDPNADEPGANRIVGTPSRHGHPLGGSLELLMFLQAGTSLAITVWIKVPGLSDTWFEFNTTPLVVLDLEVGIITGIPANTEIFLQVTAPVGAPEDFGFVLL